MIRAVDLLKVKKADSLESLAAEADSVQPFANRQKPDDQGIQTREELLAKLKELQDTRDHGST